MADGDWKRGQKWTIFSYQRRKKVEKKKNCSRPTGHKFWTGNRLFFMDSLRATSARYIPSLNSKNSVSVRSYIRQNILVTSDTISLNLVICMFLRFLFCHSILVNVHMDLKTRMTGLGYKLLFSHMGNTLYVYYINEKFETIGFYVSGGI